MFPQTLVVPVAEPANIIPQGPVIDVSSSTKWWPLSDPPVAPLGGLPLKYCSEVVVVASLLITPPRVLLW
jgi:hypothetical protein